MRIPFFSVCLSVCEQNKNCSCAKNVVVTRVVQIFISFISLNRRRCSTEMMCLHIYRRRESISDYFFFFLQKRIYDVFGSSFPELTNQFFESALYFFTIKVPTSIRFGRWHKQGKRKSLMVLIFFYCIRKRNCWWSKSLCEITFRFFPFCDMKIPKTFLFLKEKKVLFFLCFVVVCNTMTPTRRSFHPLGGTCDVALDTLSALRSFLFSKYPPKNKAKQM